MASKKNIYYRDWNELPLILTLSQLAVLFDISYETAVKWAKNRKIPAVKVADEWRVEKNKIKEIFETTSKSA